METLQKFPFQLSEEEAYLVSRYLIEDSNNQHVYVDKNNEQNDNSRIIEIIEAYKFLVLNKDVYDHILINNDIDTWLDHMKIKLQI